MAEEWVIREVKKLLEACKDRLNEADMLAVESEENFLLQHKLVSQTMLSSCTRQDLESFGFSKGAALALKTAFPTVATGYTGQVLLKSEGESVLYEEAVGTYAGRVNIYLLCQSLDVQGLFLKRFDGLASMPLDYCGYALKIYQADQTIGVVIVPKPGPPPSDMPPMGGTGGFPEMPTSPSGDQPARATTVFVGRIAASVPDSMMRELLEACGTVKSWNTEKEPSGQSTGFGFCEYEDGEGALRSLKLLNNLKVDGQELLLMPTPTTQRYLVWYEQQKDARRRQKAKERAEREAKKKAEAKQKGSDDNKQDGDADGNKEQEEERVVDEAAQEQAPDIPALATMGIVSGRSKPPPKAAIKDKQDRKPHARPPPEIGKVLLKSEGDGVPYQEAVQTKDGKVNIRRLEERLDVQGLFLKRFDGLGFWHLDCYGYTLKLYEANQTIPVVIVQTPDDAEAAAVAAALKEACVRIRQQLRDWSKAWRKGYTRLNVASDCKTEK